MRRVVIKSPVNYRLQTSADETWAERAAKKVANAPNPDWHKSGYVELSKVYDVPLQGWMWTADGYKEKYIGTGKAKVFGWLKADGSFVGFLVSVFENVLEAVPVINLDGKLTDESIQRAIAGVRCDILRRYCPNCGKFDKLRYSRTTVRCTGCGHRESTL